MIQNSFQNLKNLFNRWRFNNKDFWNDRYTNNPSKGSGPGSRGDILAQKQDIVKIMIDKYKVKTVVDYGCGDIETVRHIEFDRYVGVDVSDIVIDKNRSIKPNWEFICGNIQDVRTTDDYDLVMCLDVLIHQKTKREYFGILKKVLSARDSIVLLSGYEEPPDGWNVFFHEPLSKSLSTLDKNRRFIKTIDYRDTVLFSSETIDLSRPEA